MEASPSAESLVALEVGGHVIIQILTIVRASMMAQLVKNQPAMLGNLV